MTAVSALLNVCSLKCMITRWIAELVKDMVSTFCMWSTPPLLTRRPLSDLQTEQAPHVHRTAWRSNYAFYRYRSIAPCRTDYSCIDWHMIAWIVWSGHCYVVYLLLSIIWRRRQQLMLTSICWFYVALDQRIQYILLLLLLCVLLYQASVCVR